jgi:2-C-methyl-D-erythritol 4-phosphate cytidylyltransferase
MLRFIKRKKEKLPFCSAVILAAGSSTRMGEDKILMELDGLPLIVKTLEAFEDSPHISEVIVVTTSEKIPIIAELCRDIGMRKIRNFISGGETRMASALAGISLCSERAELIAIHDGARPFVDLDLIERLITAASVKPAVAPAVKVTDTVRQARAGRVVKTLDRDSLFLMQTPQVFERGLIQRALENAHRLGLSLTDDCEAVLLEGEEVYIVEGSEKNIKVTTPVDIVIARAILEVEDLL